MKISEKQDAKINEIGMRYNLDLIVLHGSMATRKIISPDPDIDIAVYRHGGISFDEQLKMVADFIEVFGDNVDLKTLHKKEPLFLYHAMKDSVLLYGNLHFYNEFKAYTFRCYMDAKPIFRLRDHLLRKGIDSLKKEYKIV